MSDILTEKKFSSVATVFNVQFFESVYTEKKFSSVASVFNVQFFESVYTEKKFSSADAQTFVINLPPVVDNPIPDQQVIEGDVFDFTVPANTFSDPELDTLTLSATLDDDSPLPSWLDFNPITEKFLGVPSHFDIGTLSIKVTATDPFDNFAFDIFDLEVQEDLLEKTRSLLKSFRALLPDGMAWNIDLSVQFKQVIDGIMSSCADVRDYFVGVRRDVFPDTTRSLELWEYMSEVPLYHYHH